VFKERSNKVGIPMEMRVSPLYPAGCPQQTCSINDDWIEFMKSTPNNEISGIYNHCSHLGCADRICAMLPDSSSVLPGGSRFMLPREPRLMVNGWIISWQLTTLVPSVPYPPIVHSHTHSHSHSHSHPHLPSLQLRRALRPPMSFPQPPVHFITTIHPPHA